MIQRGLNIPADKRNHAAIKFKPRLKLRVLVPLEELLSQAPVSARFGHRSLAGFQSGDAQAQLDPMLWQATTCDRPAHMSEFDLGAFKWKNSGKPPPKTEFNRRSQCERDAPLSQ